MLTFSIISFSASAQKIDPIKEKIDQAAKDPKNEERAAKADARLIDKTKVFDSIHTQQSPMQQKKKKHCNRNKQ